MNYSIFATFAFLFTAFTYAGALLVETHGKSRCEAREGYQHTNLEMLATQILDVMPWVTMIQLAIHVAIVWSGIAR